MSFLKKIKLTNEKYSNRASCVSTPFLKKILEINNNRGSRGELPIKKNKRNRPRDVISVGDDKKSKWFLGLIKEPFLSKKERLKNFTKNTKNTQNTEWMFNKKFIVTIIIN